MNRDDLIRLLRQRPFRPFVIHVSDGATYEIRHPELVLVERTTALVCFPAVDTPLPAIERFEFVALLHITRLEPLPTAPAA